MINTSVTADLNRHHEKYKNNYPFQHVAIDDFFEGTVAEMLLNDFPSFDTENAKNEMGKIGKKSVNKNMPNISQGYKILCDFLISKEFITTIEQITGIPDLIALPGGAGGTHESLSGQTLSPHIDYNYIETDGKKLHRRLNLLFYLNKNWDAAWGGNFEVHSNPRRPNENTFLSYRPDFNRCVIMECSEMSWHGYDTIMIPESKNTSRKSISIYLFSEDRPEDEIAPQHSTFYVQKPLSVNLKPCHELSKDDVLEIKQGINKRDHWIEFYQNEVLRHSAKAERQKIRGDALLAQLNALKQKQANNEG